MVKHCIKCNLEVPARELIEGVLTCPYCDFVLSGTERSGAAQRCLPSTTGSASAAAKLSESQCVRGSSKAQRPEIKKAGDETGVDNSVIQLPVSDSERFSAPMRDKMMPDDWYDRLDAGVRFAVKVLHAKGFETCQSCQGGDGHSYDQPTVDLNAAADDAWGFAAMATLQDYGLQVRELSLLWNIRNGLPYEKLWRITFWKTMEERAKEWPMFIHSYRVKGAENHSDDTPRRVSSGGS